MRAKPFVIAIFLAAAVASVPAVGGSASRAVARAWAVPNLDLGATRAVAGSGIDRTTVGRLRRAWRFTVPEYPTYSGVFASTPLIVGDRVFIETLRSNVYALDAGTGKVLWQRRFDRADGGPNGLSDTDGRLYGATDTAVFALDSGDGRVVWSRTVTTKRRPIDIAPVVALGLVDVSTTAPYPGGKGAVMALDSGTGKVRWRRSTIRGGWANPRVASGGGAWYTPTLDGRGRLYVGVANPLPWGGTKAQPNGGAYAGDDLYTDSLLVLSARTGAIAWYDQVVAHDLRDYDFAVPPVLIRSGRGPLAIGAGKGGIVIAWDRATRKRVWQAKVGVHRNDTGPLPARGVSVCPGLLGGVVTPMAAGGGRLFVPVVDLCTKGSATGSENLFSVDYAHRGKGRLVALSTATGKHLWTARFPSPDFGCATISNDLVFTSTLDGTVYALSADTGRILWEAHEPAGVNGCPSIIGNLLVVPAGAEPSTFETPVPVLDAYTIAGP